MEKSLLRLIQDRKNSPATPQPEELKIYKKIIKEVVKKTKNPKVLVLERHLN